MSTTLPTSTATRKKRSRSRIVECITNGNVEKIVKLLVNCDPNFIDESSGETPLSLAALSTTGHSTTTQQRVIVALVNGGAHLDFRNKEGKTALHVAVNKSNYVALKTFLDLGGSPNFKDSQGLTPLFYSILNKSNPKVTQLLLHEHSIHGLRDQHGWQEVHHACKLGLVTHLEQLLYYGGDMDTKVVGSGNTPLHVAAINDQQDCARVLLLRGCDTQTVNNSHQNAYQVAVIAGNLVLSELIKNHKTENVVPYRDKPKYNPARRPQSGGHFPGHLLAVVSDGHSNQQHLQQHHPPPQSVHSNGTGQHICCPASPCLSQRSCATSTTMSTTTTSSSGVCCELDHCSQCSEGASDDSNLITAYETGRGMESETDDSSNANSRRSDGQRVKGRREQKMGIGSSTTLPARGRRATQLATSVTANGTGAPVSQSPTGSDGSSPSNSSDSSVPPPITSYTEKTVSLHRGNKGFGFVLRGAKATSPNVCQPTQLLQPISLQYLDEIEENGVAQVAGLEKGDFLLNVNGVDVRSAPHEQVVQLIRISGDKVTMVCMTH